MRLFSALTSALALLPISAHAHAGHIVEAAGHDHWLAAGAVAAAAAVTAWAVLAGRKGKPETGAEPETDETESETESA
ncbi:DUF6732 family protein [Frigidibacter sp. ROC022]|uniref:DUF6732 family protein n=1 Tax=Frigidibacter sp. ROC022 TaxID=2971796 RepID=UPI00215AD46F|nr:DUF6732 family protein [Frigidibacter sp. ROC022]MCR8724812.1 hypothetical protein [Frigidibacter sp. ROC022]